VRWSRRERERSSCAEGAGVVRKISSAATDGAFSVVEHPLEPGALAAPPHTHADVDEYSFAIEGEIGVLVGEETFKALPLALYSPKCVEKLSGKCPRGHPTVCPGGTKCPDLGSFVSTCQLLKPRFGANSDFPDSFRETVRKAS
jgi:hypothetical protein